MKKLFNYALLAAALLIGVNVNAQTYVAEVAGVQYETLDDAFSAALTAAIGGEEITIKSIAPASVPMAAITIKNGEKLVWNVNGQTISMDASNTAFGIKLLKGYLKITNGEAATPGNITFYGVYGHKDYDAETTVQNYYFLHVKGANPSDSHNSQGDYYNNYYTKFVLDKNVNISCIHNAYGIAISHNEIQSDNKYYAIGVAVEIAGHVDATWGAMSTNGNLSKVDEAQAAHIHIMDGAELIGTTNDAAGIYAGGFAYWDIDRATIIGATGLYAKAGVFTLTDTKVTGNGAAVTPQAYGNGFESTGDGIVLDSHGSYAGGISVTVNGNTKINSENGYGVQEVLTQGTEDKCEKINIVSGSISGEQGALVTTETGKGNTVIEGGTFNSDITEYLGDNNIVTPTIDDNGNTIYVIGTKDPGTAWKDDITTAQAGDYVKLGQNADQTIGSGSTSSSIEAEYLVTEKNAKVTIPTGKTLTVEEIVMSAESQIIVEKGAKLIVKGEKGIVANQASNIVLKSEENAPAFFLLDPDVTSNKTPKATINFTSKAWRTNADEKEYQYFGAPTVGGSIDKIVANPATYKTQLDAWNGAGWSRVGIMDGNDDSELDYGVFNRAFGFYSILSTNPKGVGNRITYTFSGNLYGNSNPEVAVEHGWAPMSNGFTGTMDGTAILNVLEGTGVDEVVYTPSQTASGHIQWIGHTGIRYLEEVKPMDVFMLRNNADKNDVTLNYKNLVWTPATTTPSQAPRANRYAMATIRVNGSDLDDIVTVAEDDKFSADFDNGFDAEKYNNEDICFFVNADKKYDIFATDNLNNTFVGLMTTKDGKYTISFEDVTANFALVDTKTNARIEMAEGNTYEFLAEAGEDAYRFQIVAGAKAPTDMQKTNAAVKATRALINGQIVISNGERFFNVLGAEVK